MAQVQSAVRIPTPPPGGYPDPSPSPSPPPAKTKSLKRKSPSSRSPPPSRRPDRDAQINSMADRERQLEEAIRSRPAPTSSKPLTDEEKQELAKKEYERLMEKSRSGGTYIPPARLRALQKDMSMDKASKEYQRQAWEALKKSINGLINKANTGNLRQIIPELFQEDLVRGRGAFCNSLMRAQAASLPYSAMFASLVAVVVSKLPQVGQLLINRLTSRFAKAYRRNDKAVCLSCVHFIAHLTNQAVVEEKLVMQMLLLLLQNPTDDSVEIAVALTREVGAYLQENNRPVADLIFTQFREILQTGDIDKRTMYAVEVLFQTRKDAFKDNVAVSETLDLVEEEDKYTLKAPDLDSQIDLEQGLNIFKFDPDYEAHEKEWARVRADILGEGSDDDDDDDGSESGSEEDEEAEEEKMQDIKDLTAEELTRLRRTIYLTINSASTFEEACHKLMKISLPQGRESELPSMIIETCSQRPTYEKFYGLIGERLCQLSRFIQAEFEEQFAQTYATIHRYETNRLRSIAQFFAHLIGTNAIGWHVFSTVILTEAETTSSSRIFIKILFQGIVEELGTPQLATKLKDPILQPSFTGLFPTEHPRDTRFSINYFTSIGLGAITEGMREHLTNLPKPAPLPAPAQSRGRSRSVSSYSSYTSSSSYSSRSSSYSRSRSRSLSRSPSRSRR